MKTERFVKELESLIEQLGYQVRKEKGSFKGDFCVLEGQDMVVLNKSFPSEFQVGQMARFVLSKNPESLFIKPAVRKELDKYRERIKREVDEQ